MITRRVKIRRHLRSVRTTALTEEERRQALREAQARVERDDRQGEHDDGQGEHGDGQGEPAGLSDPH